jgi:hypothetical protein
LAGTSYDAADLRASYTSAFLNTAALNNEMSGQIWAHSFGQGDPATLGECRRALQALDARANIIELMQSIREGQPIPALTLAWSARQLNEAPTIDGDEADDDGSTDDDDSVLDAEYITAY